MVRITAGKRQQHSISIGRKIAQSCFFLCLGFYTHSLFHSEQKPQLQLQLQPQPQEQLQNVKVESVSASRSEASIEIRDETLTHVNVSDATATKTKAKTKPKSIAKGRKHWCIIGPKFLPKTTREHFTHFPHTTEILLPCWSYFMEQGATENCGFYLASDKMTLSPWPKELIDTMGCEVTSGTKPPDVETGLVPSLPADDVQFIPNLYLLRPRFNYIRYIKHPSHAHALRKLFISDEDIAAIKGGEHPLQIGMIQRTTSRRIGNFDDIKEALHEAIPNAFITTTNFEFSSVKEQAQWFATKDVIIAAHGAAVVNSLFITEGTIVMQLYPPGYFWESLEPLIEQSGGHAIQWYEKQADPYMLSATEDREIFDAAGQGLTPFSPPVDEVVKPIVYSLGIDTPTNKKLFNLYGDWI